VSEKGKRLPDWRTVPTWALVAGLVGLSTLVRFWAGNRIRGLWIMPDEAIYAEVAQSLYRSGEFSILGQTAYYSFVYPALIGLPLVAGDLERGYVMVKLVQALAMSLTAVPVYLWGRQLTSRGWALAAALLTVAGPALLFTGLLMTEVAFYPMLVLAAWAMARALERPTRRRQAILILAIAGAAATRLQAMVLVPVLLTALVLKALFDRDRRTIVRFTPTLAGVGVLSLAWIAFRLKDGGSWTRLLGSYAAAGEKAYDPVEAANFVVYHLADVLLLTALFPVCAVVLLTVEAARGRERSEAVRAYLAVTLALSVWLILEVGVFASANVGRLAERDLIGLAPVLFLGFCVWLRRGGARPLLLTSVVVLALLVPVLALPLDRMVVSEALTDAFTVVPLFWLVRDGHETAVQAVVYGGAAVLLALFALLPRRALLVLPAVVLAALVGTSFAATQEITKRANYDQEFLLGGKRDWVDEAAKGRTAYLFAGEFYWNGVWQALFWNSKLQRIYSRYPAVVPGPLPQEYVITTGDGRLLQSDGSEIPERYVIATTNQKLIGRPITSIRQTGLESEGLTLWRVQPPLRLSYTVTGVRRDGDMHEPGRIIAYDCRGGGFFRVQLIAKASKRVEVFRNRGLYERLTFRGPDQTWGAEIPAGEGSEDGTCTLEVRGDSLLGSTVFEFVRV
jgi:hypothetical protein